jgi:hypothetical protein
MPHAMPHAAATVVPQVEAVEIAVAPSVRRNLGWSLVIRSKMYG